MIYSIKTPHNHPQGKIFSWMTLTLALGVGLSIPIFPNFVKSILLTDSGTSIFYSAMAALMLLGALASSFIFKKIHRTTIAQTSFLLSAMAFLLFTFITDIVPLSVLNTIKVCFLLFASMSLALFVRDFAKTQNLGKTEGMYFKYQNIGAFIGLLAGGFLAAKFGYEIIFILSAVILIAGSAYFYAKYSIQNHPAIINRKHIPTTTIFKNIKLYFSNKERVKAYFVTFTEMSWFCFRRLYIPLYVAMSGYMESLTGLVMALGIIPYILLEVKVGEYADKKGIRLPISTGFLIIALILLIIFICPYPFVNFTLLVLANIGASFVEPLQDYYLFKNLPPEQEDNLYGIFMTADPIASFIVPALGAGILFFLPFNYLFLIFGILLMLASFLFWKKLRNNVSNSADLL